MNSDRTTKALLAAIALGIWVIGFLIVVQTFALNGIADHTGMLERWTIAGAPVKLER